MYRIFDFGEVDKLHDPLQQFFGFLKREDDSILRAVERLNALDFGGFRRRERVVQGRGEFINSRDGSTKKVNNMLLKSEQAAPAESGPDLTNGLDINRGQAGKTWTRRNLRAGKELSQKALD